MQISDTPNKIAIQFARDGAKREIPNSSQIGVGDGAAASYTDGFPPITMIPKESGGIPPYGKDMNGVLNQITAIQRYQCAGGLFRYDSVFSASVGGYPKGAQLMKSDGSGVWHSTVDNNTSNPDTGGAGWITGAASAMYVPPGASGIPTTVQTELRRQIWLDNYPSLHAAIADLALTGGVINLSNKAYPPEVWKFDTAYMSTPNITLRGVKMPKPSANCDRLVGGSIIQGRFNVYADNFAVENIGFDQGKYVVDTYYGGLDTHTANHPNGDTWDSFAFAQPNQAAPLPQRTGFYAKNVIALARDSQSFGHAFLSEGYTGGYLDNVIGIGGIHAVVIKGVNVSVGKIAGYSASSEYFILKSDSYAPCNNVSINSIDTAAVYPGTTPWFTPAVSIYGVLFNPQGADMASIRIGTVRINGAQRQLAALGPMASGSPTRILDNLKIESCELEGLGIAAAQGIVFDSLSFFRCAIDSATINNVVNGLVHQQYATVGAAASPFTIGTLRFGGSITGSAIRCIDYARVMIDKLICESATSALYNVDDLARIQVGVELINGSVTTKFSNNPPTLNAAWSQSPGNSVFRVVLDNYGVLVAGLLVPVGAGAAQVCTLPVYLRTRYASRFLTYAKGTGGVHNSVVVNVDPTVANLQINDGINATRAEQLLSLDGVRWTID